MRVRQEHLRPAGSAVVRRLLAGVAVAGLAGGLALTAGAPADAAARPAHPNVAAERAALGLGPDSLPNAAQISSSQEDTCAVAAFKAGVGYTPALSTNDGSYPPILVAIAVGLAESTCNPAATDDDSNGSVDRGIWQINNEAHPNVSNACAYQAQCNGDAMWTISSGGRNWSAWTTYNSGAWESYIGDAQSALNNGYVVELEDLGNANCINFSASDGGNGGRIQQWSCLADSPQEQLTVEYQSGHDPVLEDVGNGTCLNFSKSNGGNGGVIQQWACLTDSQQEEVTVLGSGDLNTNGDADALVQDDGNGTCLNFSKSNNGNGGVIEQWACLSSSQQEELN
jgi:Lysozyme like domain